MDLHKLFKKSNDTESDRDILKKALEKISLLEKENIFLRTQIEAIQNQINNIYMTLNSFPYSEVLK